MNKIVIALILITGEVCHAQWHIGGKAGITLSNYKTQTPWKEASNMGFMISLTGMKQITPSLGIKIGLDYVQKGYYHKVCNTISDQLNADYLEVPIMVSYVFPIPWVNNLNAHAGIGLYSAYWLSGKYKTEGMDDSGERFDFQKSEASRFDFGPAAGSALEYRLKHGSVLLDFRYELGLLDLQKKANDNTSNINRALIIGISYFLPIGH